MENPAKIKRKRISSGVVALSKSDCVECMSCVGFCPTLSMRYHSDQGAPFKCIACGKCVPACKQGALYIENIK